MAYTEPTFETFTTRFPEFSSLDQSLVELVLDEAKAEVGANWPDSVRATAQLYLTAHLLTVEGGDDRRVDRHLQGPVTSLKEGPVATTYADPRDAQSTGDAYASTAYGRRFAEIRKRTFAGQFYAV